MSRFLRWPEGGVRFFRAEVAGGCELPNLGIGNQTRVLYKNMKDS